MFRQIVTLRVKVVTVFQFNVHNAIIMKSHEFLVVLLSVNTFKCLVDGQSVPTLPRLVTKYNFYFIKKKFLCRFKIKMGFSFPWQIGDISVAAPAFADIHESSDSSLPYAERFTLYLSTFKPFQIKVYLNLFILVE